MLREMTEAERLQKIREANVGLAAIIAGMVLVATLAVGSFAVEHIAISNLDTFVESWKEARME